MSGEINGLVIIYKRKIDVARRFYSHQIMIDKKFICKVLIITIYLNNIWLILTSV